MSTPSPPTTTTTTADIDQPEVMNGNSPSPGATSAPSPGTNSVTSPVTSPVRFVTGTSGVSMVPVPQGSPLVGIALPQTLLAPRLVAPMLQTVSPVVTLATPTIPSVSSQGPSGQGHQGSTSGQGTLIMGVPPKSQMTADGEVILDVECGPNKAKIYLSKLCQGSKGPCVLYNQAWLTPNEFQYVSGRETAKDWKRSIRHHGKSMKLLMAKGVMTLNPPSCRCEACTGIDPFANNNLPLQESLAVNTSTSALKSISQQHHPVGSSPAKVKVSTTTTTSSSSAKKSSRPDKKPMSGNMADTAGTAGGVKAVQADVNANTLGPVTSSSGTAGDCYEFRDSPVQPVCALPPMLHPIPRGIPSIGTLESLKSEDSEKENTRSPPMSSTLTPPGGPTLLAYPVMPIPTAHMASATTQQPAFPSRSPEPTDTEAAVSENLSQTNRECKTSPELKLPTSVLLSPGKIGQVDSRDPKENQSKVFAPITWPPVVLGNIPPQGQTSRSHKTSPKSSPPSSSAVPTSLTTSAASSTLQKSPSSSSTSAAPAVSPSLAKPTPTVVGLPAAPSAVPAAVPGLPPVTISATAVPAGYHEYMASMMARYNMMQQNARMDEANYMTMVRKYYSDWYEMYSRYPYAAMSAGAMYPPTVNGAESLKTAIPGMMPFPGYMYPMATSDPRLVDLSNRAAATAAAIKEAEAKQMSPTSGLKRSYSDSGAGQTSDVLDLSVKKSRVESPVASRPSTVIPSHPPNPLTHSISGLVPSVGIPGHPGIGLPVSTAGLTVPVAGLPAPTTLQSLAAAGYPAGMFDPRALALASGNGTSATLSFAHAQQQALTLPSVGGYPMAAAYMPPGLAFPQLCSTNSDREKLLKAQHVQLAGDIRM